MLTISTLKLWEVCFKISFTRISEGKRAEDLALCQPHTALLHQIALFPLVFSFDELYTVYGELWSYYKPPK